MGAKRGAVYVLSTAKAWLVLLPGVTSPVWRSSCADTLQWCELHQDLPNPLVTVLTEAPSLWGCRPACKENSLSKQRCGWLCHRADAIWLGCQPQG